MASPQQVEAFNPECLPMQFFQISLKTKFLHLLVRVEVDSINSIAVEVRGQNFSDAL